MTSVKSDTGRMLTENTLQVRPHTLLKYQNVAIEEHNTNRSLVPMQNVYSVNSGGEEVKGHRETNDVHCFHPSQRVPFLNPENVGSWEFLRGV
jgi:hypothetical protein